MVCGSRCKLDVDVVEDGKFTAGFKFSRGESAGDKAPTGVSTIIPAPAGHARPNASAQLGWNCAVPFA
jgi:hypothetical protein